MGLADVFIRISNLYAGNNQTYPSTVLELHGPSIDALTVVQKRQSADFDAKKL